MTATAAQPDADALPRPKRRPRWWGVLLILLAVLLALFTAYRLALHYRLSTELAALRAAGYPTNLEELKDYLGPPPPDEENGARLYRLAWSRFVSPPDEDVPDLPIGARFSGSLEPADRLPPRVQGAIGRHLDGNAEAVDLLHRAGELPRARFVDRLPARSDLVWHASWIRSYRHGANLLKLEAMMHMERGDPANTAASLRSAWRAAEAFAEEPFSIGHLIRTGLRRTTVEQIERALHHTHFTEEQLADLMAMLSDEDDAALRRALASNRAWLLASMETACYWDLPYARVLTGWGLEPWTRGVLRVSGVPDYRRAAWAADTHARLLWAEQDWPHRLAATRGAGTAEEELMGHEEAHTIARIRCARAALAVERHRLAHGTLPESLADLAPDFIDAVPLDPFTGEPLKYKRLDAGYTIYSVGEDRIDHGGIEGRADGPRVGTGADIPFTVAR